MSGNTPQFSPSLFNQYIIAFEGSSVACILFGVYLVIAGTNISLLQKRRYRVLLSLTIAQLVITTFYIGMSLYAAPAQSLAIFNIVDTFGGPDALSSWPAIFVGCAFVLNTWLSDAFLLYRCYIVWMGNKYVLVSAGLFYIVTFATSLAWLIVSSMPNAVYSTRSVQVAGICFWSCSAAMNIFASCLISVRLCMHRKAISSAVGSQQGGFYLSYMAMTLESALLYAGFVLIALIVFTANSPLQNVFFPVLGNVQVIAPALIIYRIARGISFETDEYSNVTTPGGLRFAPSDLPKSLLRPIRPGMLHRSDTLRDAKTDRDGSQSFILDDIKDDV